MVTKRRQCYLRKTYLWLSAVLLEMSISQKSRKFALKLRRLLFSEKLTIYAFCSLVRYYENKLPNLANQNWRKNRQKGVYRKKALHFIAKRETSPKWVVSGLRRVCLTSVSPWRGGDGTATSRLSRASLIGEHFPCSCDLNICFKCDIVRRNYTLCTINVFDDQSSHLWHEKLFKGVSDIWRPFYVCYSLCEQDDIIKCVYFSIASMDVCIQRFRKMSGEHLLSSV